MGSEKRQGKHEVFYTASLYPDGWGGATKHMSYEEAESARQEMKQRGYKNVHVWRRSVEYFDDPHDGQAD